MRRSGGFKIFRTYDNRKPENLKKPIKQKLFSIPKLTKVKATPSKKSKADDKGEKKPERKSLTDLLYASDDSDSKPTNNLGEMTQISAPSSNNNSSTSKKEKEDGIGRNIGGRHKPDEGKGKKDSRPPANPNQFRRDFPENNFWRTPPKDDDGNFIEIPNRGQEPKGKPKEFDLHKYSPSLKNIMDNLPPGEDFIAYESMEGGPFREINMLNNSDASTIAHELTHSIDFHNSRGNNRAFFNSETGKISYLDEPELRNKIGSVGRLVPENLRGMPGSSNQGRFGSYLGSGRMANMPDNPLYVLEEWNAYINGALAGNEIIGNAEEKWSGGKQDGVAGALEFSAYSAALARAIEREDPGYFDRHPEFAQHIKAQAQRAKRVFDQGQANRYFNNPKQRQYLQDFQEYLGQGASDRVRDMFSAFAS